MKRINASGRSVLVIGDLHIPFHHPDVWKWLAAIKKKYLNKKSIIISIGDEVDGHTISFHNDEIDLPFSPSSELQESINIIHMKGGLHDLFPTLKILDSNHGSLVFRRSKVNRIPLHYLKELKDVYETPKWSWHDEVYLKTRAGDIYLCHGRSSSSGKLAGSLGCSTIQGHYHGKFGITWYSNGNKSRFCCYTGCLIDEKSLAFNYGRLSIAKPILGSVLITEDGTPRLLRMTLDKNNRWDGKLP